MSSGGKRYFGKFIWDLNRRTNCLGMLVCIMKCRWAINKSIQGVPTKVKEFKIEITLVILGQGDQFDTNGKLRHLIT